MRQVRERECCLPRNHQSLGEMEERETRESVQITTRSLGHAKETREKYQGLKLQAISVKIICLI